MCAFSQITLGVYAGWYSVRDEAFYGEAELVDGKAPSGTNALTRTLDESDLEHLGLAKD